MKPLHIKIKNVKTIRRSNYWKRTLNARVKDSKSKPIKVIIKRCEIIHIQHNICVIVAFIICIVLFRLGCRICVALCPHFISQRLMYQNNIVSL